MCEFVKKWRNSSVFEANHLWTELFTHFVLLVYFGSLWLVKCPPAHEKISWGLHLLYFCLLALLHALCLNLAHLKPLRSMTGVTTIWPCQRAICLVTQKMLYEIQAWEAQSQRNNKTLTCKWLKLFTVLFNISISFRKLHCHASVEKRTRTGLNMIRCNLWLIYCRCRLLRFHFGSNLSMSAH